MRRRSNRPLQQGVLIAAAALLAACQTCPVQPPRVEYKLVPTAVASGCVKDAPAPVQGANKRITAEEWAQRAPGAHAETIKVQVAEHMNYEDQLRSAVAGCKPVDSSPSPQG